jgi:hypothetical protein
VVRWGCAALSDFLPDIKLRRPARRPVRLSVLLTLVMELVLLVASNTLLALLLVLLLELRRVPGRGGKGGRDCVLDGRGGYDGLSSSGTVGSGGGGGGEYVRRYAAPSGTFGGTGGEYVRPYAAPSDSFGGTGGAPRFDLPAFACGGGKCVPPYGPGCENGYRCELAACPYNCSYVGAEGVGENRGDNCSYGGAEGDNRGDSC